MFVVFAERSHGATTTREVNGRTACCSVSSPHRALEALLVTRIRLVHTPISRVALHPVRSGCRWRGHDGELLVQQGKQRPAERVAPASYGDGVRMK